MYIRTCSAGQLTEGSLGVGGTKPHERRRRDWGREWKKPTAQLYGIEMKGRQNGSIGQSPVLVRRSHAEPYAKHNVSSGLRFGSKESCKWRGGDRTRLNYSLYSWKCVKLFNETSWISGRLGGLFKGRKLSRRHEWFRAGGRNSLTLVKIIITDYGRLRRTMLQLEYIKNAPFCFQAAAFRFAIEESKI